MDNRFAIASKGRDNRFAIASKGRVTKRLLCVDGGGVKGVIVAQFLKRLEEHLPNSLYETFDMFAGTSTGSLLVSAIAYEKMSGEQIADDLYSQLNCEKIMKKSIWDRILGTVQTAPEYESTGLEELIDEKIPHKPKICDTDKDVIITTFDVNNYKPLFFKSYNLKHNILLKDALCMSSAAPAYFPTYHNKEQNIYGIDGGIFANNPTDCAYADALLKYGKDADIRIISIGTGYNYPTGMGEESIGFGGIEWMTQGNLIDLIFKAPQATIDYKMKTFTKALGHEYIHVNAKIHTKAMDDTSEENIKALRKIGDDWWDQFGQDVLKVVH